MPHHRYPDFSDRPTTGPATRLGSETLATSEKGLAQAFSKTGF